MSSDPIMGQILYKCLDLITVLCILVLRHGSSKCTSCIYMNTHVYLYMYICIYVLEYIYIYSDIYKYTSMVYI